VGIEPLCAPSVKSLIKGEDLSSLRRLLARRRHTAARVQLTAVGMIALLRRSPPDAAVYVSVGDLNTLVAAGDERQVG
jgi:hypothetical protein